MHTFKQRKYSRMVEVPVDISGYKSGIRVLLNGAYSWPHKITHIQGTSDQTHV